MGSRLFVRDRTNLAVEIVQATVRPRVIGRAPIAAIGRAQRTVPRVAAAVPAQVKQVTRLPIVLSGQRAVAVIVAVP
jgi:hypothetical protein